jgi:hypothetical protein
MVPIRHWGQRRIGRSALIPFWTATLTVKRPTVPFAVPGTIEPLHPRDGDYTSEWIASGSHPDNIPATGRAGGRYVQRNA